MVSYTPRVKEIFSLTRLDEVLASFVHPAGEGVDQFRG